MDTLLIILTAIALVFFVVAYVRAAARNAEIALAERTKFYEAAERIAHADDQDVPIEVLVALKGFGEIINSKRILPEVVFDLWMGRIPSGLTASTISRDVKRMPIPLQKLYEAAIRALGRAILHNNVIFRWLALRWTPAQTTRATIFLAQEKHGHKHGCAATA